MQVIFRGSRQNTLIRGILTTAIGLLFLAMPGLTLKTVVISVGSMLLLSGVISIILSYARKRKGIGGSIQGFFNLILGVVFIVSPLAIVQIFSYFIGIIFLLMGLFQFLGAMGSLSKSVWSLFYLVFAIMMIFGGAFLLVHPVESAKNLLTFFGSILVLYGVIEMVTAWRNRKNSHLNKGGNTLDTTYEEL
ncbi:MAG: DUF308 domain-containing protein [Marinilabiliales bacterium]|nr:DUF308 domain-containing protein [Marinilabiliales bacterium]